jgi:hypothetical protein
LGAVSSGHAAHGWADAWRGASVFWRAPAGVLHRWLCLQFLPWSSIRHCVLGALGRARGWRGVGASGSAPPRPRLVLGRACGAVRGSSVV